MVEKDIDKIPKNPDTDIVIRIDDFGGRVGLTIREFVHSERYTGFTKAGTRIPGDYIKQFKEAIASIDENEVNAMSAAAGAGAGEEQQGELSSGANESEEKSDKKSDEGKESGDSGDEDNAEQSSASLQKSKDFASVEEQAM